MQIVKAVKVTPTGMTFNSKGKRGDYLAKQTRLGPNYIKSMPYYCKGTGLLDFDYNLTPFGKVVLNNHPARTSGNIMANALPPQCTTWSRAYVLE